MKRLVYFFVVFFHALLLFLAPFAKAKGTYTAASCNFYSVTSDLMGACFQ
jgi:hypothetical protein